MSRPVDPLQLASELREKGEGFVLCTVVDATASTPGRPGFKMLVRPDGSSHGTVGGGEIERSVISAALAMIREKASVNLLRFKLTEDNDGLGMQCGGDIQVFLEHMPPQRRAWLFGAGHMCQSLTPLLCGIGFSVTAIDDREGMATTERLPNASMFHTGDYADFTREFAPASGDAAVIFTHGHSADHIILAELCRRRIDCAYIGMIGSRTKVAATFAEIEQAQPGSREWLDRVHAPIGLNVARRTTSEIAIAIVAEMLAAYNEVGTIRRMRDTR